MSNTKRTVSSYLVLCTICIWKDIPGLLCAPLSLPAGGCNKAATGFHGEHDTFPVAQEGGVEVGIVARWWFPSSLCRFRLELSAQRWLKTHVIKNQSTVRVCVPGAERCVCYLVVHNDWGAEIFTSSWFQAYFHEPPPIKTSSVRRRLFLATVLTVGISDHDGGSSSRNPQWVTVSP